MIKIDLITGFLGSGKTTFIKKYARYLMDKGLNIGILENDYGAINVDMMLLKDLEGEQCELEMISGGCDQETHRRRFRTKLIAMGMCGYDRILVEPSGIYDVDEFFDALREDPVDRWYEVGSVIAVVNACLDDHLTEHEAYYLASEVADAGCVLLSRMEEAGEEQAKKTLERLETALQEIGCKKKVQECVLAKNWEDLTEEDFARIQNVGMQQNSYQKKWFPEEESFETAFFMNLDIERKQAETLVQSLFEDSDCGKIIRVKGFLQDGNQWLELNATRGGCEIRPAQDGQNVWIVIGERLKKERIEARMQREFAK